jgi:TetR/AcrR family transcriptional regulator
VTTSTPRRAGRPAAGTTGLPTEEQILDRGLAAFAELGYEATSVRELSRRLGVSHNFINDRYGSKESFWRMLIDTAGSPVIGPLGRIASAPYEDELLRFRDGVRLFLAVTAANPEITRIINQESSSGSPRLDYVYRRHVEPIVQTLRPAFEHLVAEGRLRDVPFVAMMFSIIAMTGVASHRGLLTLIGPGSDDDASDFSAHLADIVLEGLILNRSAEVATSP